MKAVSLFNDVIGPALRHPAAHRTTGRDLMEGAIEEVLVEFD